jgi:hypothetical protein
MLLTVKKQVEETLEVKTPCYYKSISGGINYINESGQLVSISSRMISIWDQKDGGYYNDEIVRLVNTGKPCEKEEFEAAYNKAMAEMNAAVGLVEVNS